MISLVAPGDTPILREQLPEFGQLYERHVDAVWRVLARLGLPEADLEDAVQEVFWTAHRRRSTFRGQSQVKTWLVGIALRVAANWRRRASTLRVALEGHEHVSSSQPPDVTLEQRQAWERLAAIVSRLPADQREVFVLSDLEEWTAPEIAEATETNLNTVYSRLRLARRGVEAALAEGASHV